MESHNNPQEKYTPNERDIAYHEAAHTVTGYLFYSVDYVNIYAGMLLGMATGGSTKINTPEHMYLGGAENEDMFIEYLKIIICLRSGRHFQMVVSAVDDAAGAYADEDFLSTFLYNDNNQYYKPFDFMMRNMTIDFCSIDNVVKMVVVVAEALISRKELRTKEIDELLKDMNFNWPAVLQNIKEKYYRSFCSLLKPYKIMPILKVK